MRRALDSITSALITNKGHEGHQSGGGRFHLGGVPGKPMRATVMIFGGLTTLAGGASGALLSFFSGKWNSYQAYDGRLRCPRYACESNSARPTERMSA